MIWNKIKKGAVWFFKSFIWIVPLTIILDQLTKLIVEKNNVQNLEIIKNFFYINLQRNDGVGFSIFSGEGMTEIFGLLSFVAGVIMIVYLVARYKKMIIGNRIALLLIIGGCFGNMIDRLFYEDAVIDFLSFHFGSYNFPTFNLADAFLVIGVIVLIIIMILEEFSGTKDKKLATSSNSGVENIESSTEEKKDE